MKDKSAKVKKAEQRKKWKAEGWTEICVRVAKENVEDVRKYVAALSPPKKLENPNQEYLPFGEEFK